MKADGERPLDVVQRWMQAVLTHPLGVEAGVASDEAQREIALAPDELARMIEPSRQLDSAERMAIYANAYYARLMECLTDEFPVLAKLLGEDAFNDLAFGYLRTYPSRSYTLTRLGCDFAQYLDESRPQGDDAADDWIDMLVEMARLEWTFNEVFNGPGTEREAPLDATALARIDPRQWPSARLTPAPCLRLLELRFPVNGLYTAVRDDEPFGLPSREMSFVAVSRRAYVVERHDLEPAAYRLLSALVAGSTVEDAIALAADDPTLDPAALPARLQAWFQQWTGAGFFLAVELPPAE